MFRTRNPDPSFPSICPTRQSSRHSAAIGLSLVLLLTALIPRQAFAQTPVPVRGVVLAPTGETVAGARIEIAGLRPVTTDESGRFQLELKPGDWELVVSHPAYRVLRHRVTVGTETIDLELLLDWVTSVEESITVVGIRAGEDVPVTKRNIDREEIETFSYGQDVPQLLEHTPSMNWYSDSGIGSNYSYFTMRGIQQTRINMTFDGAPLNDPAEHALYFNNFHDFLSDVDSIQIQRGVGTSAVGSPAYGGSVNFASPGPSQDRGGDARLVLGSYDTARASIGYESGLFRNGLYVSGRFSYANTDGYREHSGSEHHTLFLNAGWQSDRSSLKLVTFSGDEKSQLAYLAVEPDILDQNRRFNSLTEEDRDEFGQDFAQLKYTRDLGGEKLLTASFYYNGAQGWFQLWDDPVAQNDLLRFGIDQGFVGSMVTLSANTDNLSATFGVHYNDFSGDHFLDTDANGRIYKNTGFKETANAFGKLEYGLGQTLLFGDLQLRWAQFSYEGDVDLGSVDWTFLDPKVGIRQTLSPGLSLYGSIGRAQREPARLDLLLGEDNATVPHDLEAVKPESVTNFEGGVDLNTQELALQANVYLMEFRNEIALTGELSEIGLPLRRNVDRSYRRGVEVDLRWMPLSNWTVMHSLNVSRNRIDSWTQFYDVYDAEGAWVGSEPITYQNVRPLLSPELVFNLGAEWANRDTSVRLMGRYVAESQLDNTGLSEFQTPSFTNVDLRASQSLGRFWEGADARITLFVNNLLDNQDQFPSGYSYQFLVRDGAGGETLDGIPYYYPLATRNFVVELEVGF
ncbi:MAG TPA: TonB-dependent receptor [Vicinamibacteria bacterium]